MSYQPSLFDSPPDVSSNLTSPRETHLSLPDGEISYYPSWLSTSSLSPLAPTLYDELRRQVAWEQTEIVLYGKKMRIPRLNAWYAEPQCGYTYSGKYFEPLPWLPLLVEIKAAVEKTLRPLLIEGATQEDVTQKESTPREIFNSVLVNCYRDGQDSVAWHSDDEPELGNNPIVASLSLGADRQFQLRHKNYKQQVQHAKSEQYKQNIRLSNGDLLLMHGNMQHCWQHQIPKTKKAVGERINITFRKIKYPAVK
ncbi:Alkylated DNA repair protein [gamma proteobacterium IMCC1989]|nr:Alkylated DNA repair protein [gamma proteobacterium IMCC1989]